MGYFAENFDYILEKLDIKRAAKDATSVALFGGASPVMLASQFFPYDDIEKLKYRRSNGKEYKGPMAFEMAFNDYCNKVRKSKTAKEYLSWSLASAKKDIKNKCKAASKNGNFDLNKVFNL